MVRRPPSTRSSWTAPVALEPHCPLLCFVHSCSASPAPMILECLELAFGASVVGRIKELIKEWREDLAQGVLLKTFYASSPRTCSPEGHRCCSSPRVDARASRNEAHKTSIDFPPDTTHAVPHTVHAHRCWPHPHTMPTTPHLPCLVGEWHSQVP